MPVAGGSCVVMGSGSIPEPGPSQGPGSTPDPPDKVVSSGEPLRRPRPGRSPDPWNFIGPTGVHGGD